MCQKNWFVLTNRTRFRDLIVESIWIKANREMFWLKTWHTIVSKCFHISHNLHKQTLNFIITMIKSLNFWIDNKNHIMILCMQWVIQKLSWNIYKNWIRPKSDSWSNSFWRIYGVNLSAEQQTHSICFCLEFDRRRSFLDLQHSVMK